MLCTLWWCLSTVVQSNPYIQPIKWATEKFKQGSTKKNYLNVFLFSYLISKKSFLNANILSKKIKRKLNLYLTMREMIMRSNFMRSKFNFFMRLNFRSWGRIHEIEFFFIFHEVEIPNNDLISWSALFHEIEIA
jgi:hypothetical protein